MIPCYEACTKHVCNAMTLHSKCCDCCSIDIEAEIVSDSEYEFEINDVSHFRKNKFCLYYKKSYKKYINIF